jgi:hypothetical protein
LAALKESAEAEAAAKGEQLAAAAGTVSHTPTGREKLQPAGGGGDDATNTPTGCEKLQPAGGGDDATNTPTGREKLQPAGGFGDATSTHRPTPSYLKCLHLSNVICNNKCHCYHIIIKRRYD